MTAGETGRALRERRLDEARAILARADRQRRMGQVLRDGGFAPEALAPLRDAIGLALKAVTHWAGTSPEPGDAAAFVEAAVRFGNRAQGESPSESALAEVLDSGVALMDDASRLFTSASLE